MSKNSVNFASILGLSVSESARVNSAQLRKTAIDYARTAQAIPSMAGALRAELIKLSNEQPATIPVVAPYLPQSFSWVHLPGTSAAVSYVPGMQIPNGSRVYVGNQWVDYVPIATAPAVTTAKTTGAVVQTCVRVDESTIPPSANGLGKLPWILSVSRGNDNEIYCKFGALHGAVYNRCSVRASELLSALQNPALIAQLRDLIAKA